MAYSCCNPKCRSKSAPDPVEMPAVSTRVICFFLAVLVAIPAQAAVHSVRPDGLGDFPTIQAAVDAASVGDTILLEDGIFTGNGNRDVLFGGKDVIVKSRNGPDFCTIDSQGSSGDPHRAFKLVHGETSASRIEGITIIGGFVEGLFPENGGGGILVAFNSHPVITNCVFDGNETGFEGYGAGILAWEGCDVTITDCTFINGVSGWYGGGFVLRKECHGLVERCFVDNNYALHGGGGISITRSNAIVNDCIVTNNTVTEAGAGGILVKAEAEPIISRCVIAGNTAWAGGGMGLGNLPKVTAIDCLFEGNTAFGAAGGAVHVANNGSEFTFQNCTFVNNWALGFGEHIWINPTSVATLRNCVVDVGCNGVNSFNVSIGATLDIDCSVLWGGQTGIVGAGSILYGTSMVEGDAMFCAPASCSATSYPAGVYTLDSGSPASSSYHPCGLVGAYSVDCGSTSAGGASSVEPSTWGTLKGRYAE